MINELGKTWRKYDNPGPILSFIWSCVFAVAYEVTGNAFYVFSVALLTSCGSVLLIYEWRSVKAREARAAQGKNV